MIGGQGQRLALDPHALFGLDGLVQALGEAPAVHQTAGELIDDDDFAVLDDVIAVELVKHVGAQGVVQVGGQLVVLSVVQALPRCQPHQRLDACDAVLGERDDAILLIHLVIAFAGPGGERPGQTCRTESDDSCAWPEMISGVRASSIRMLSTSSTMA